MLGLGLGVKWGVCRVGLSLYVACAVSRLLQCLKFKPRLVFVIMAEAAFANLDVLANIDIVLTSIPCVAAGMSSKHHMDYSTTSGAWTRLRQSPMKSLVFSLNC
jgi:hypothetical protein